MENIQTTNETSSVSNTLENVSQLSQEQVNDSNLILGKFKTVDDLTNAYKNSWETWTIPKTGRRKWCKNAIC